MTPRLGALAAFLVLALSAPPAAQAAKQANTQPAVIHVTFHKVGTAQFVPSNGRYVLLFQPVLGGSAGTLIDQRTGKRLTTSPGCAVPGPGGAGFVGPWLAVFGCPGTAGQTGYENISRIRLYRLATGRWSTVTVNDPNCLKSGAQCSLSLGTDWLEIHESCATCTTPTNVFQNLHTRKLRRTAPRTTRTRVIDLDSPQLTSKLCAPLELPANGAVISGPEPPLGSYQLLRSGSTYFLARCGTHLHKRLPTVPASGDSHALVWGGAQKLTGILLPSLRRFSVPLPKTLQGQFGKGAQLTLSQRTIWVTSAKGLWSAPRPKLLNG